jgi:hypothetical protein
MQKIHEYDAERPFVRHTKDPHYACHEARNAIGIGLIEAFKKFMKRRIV